MKGWKENLGNGLLVAASLAIFYLIAEVVFFRLMLPHMSYNLRPYLPDRADFFMQNAKAGYAPHDYIALVGDSYAQGVGDWQLSSGGSGAKPYHSGNVLHDLLGSDVASFGRYASGSAEAMVLRITRIYDDTGCYLFPAVEKPKHILVYFYEGNDIDDNLELLGKIRPGGDKRAAVDRFLDEKYGAPSAWSCHRHLGDFFFRMGRYLYRYNLSGIPVVVAPFANKVLVNGQPTDARPLQTPSPYLSDAAVDDGVLVYERSLAWLKRHFPDVPITVVYIQSPAALYDFATPDIFAASSELVPAIYGRRFPVAEVREASHKMCDKIRTATAGLGVPFIDAGAALRAAAATRPIHGPIDWNHLNEAGYRQLGEFIAGKIDTRAAEPCSGGGMAAPVSN